MKIEKVTKNEINLNDIKPANLNICLNKFCKSCNVFKPEIESIDYTNHVGCQTFEITSYDLTCAYMPACLKYNS